MIMLENIRAALSQDIYITRGGKEVIRPAFTFHGFRYMEITGLNKPLPLHAVKGLVISSVKEIASSYETSNPKINKLWNNIKWSTLGNFLSIPTDDPQRNERMGWGGDISAFARTATYLIDASQFLSRHLLSMRNTQRDDGRFTDVSPMGGGFGGILWGSAGIIVAWETYQQYNDKEMLRDHYMAMKRYIEFLDGRIDRDAGIMNEGPLGDWLSPETGRNDNTLIWEANFIFNLDLMTRIATILGEAEDAVWFRKKHEERKTFFNNIYVDPETRKTVKSGFIAPRRPAVRQTDGAYSMAAGTLMDTQISYAVPLAFGVFNTENKRYAADYLANAVRRKNMDDNGNLLPEYSLMTGYIGTAVILKALSDYGYDDVAYRLLQQTSYPSWLYSVDQGATTMWERWNSYTVENGFGGNNVMNSFNHYIFGAVGAWMCNYSLGIERDENEPGFKRFILQPTPDPDGEMTFARGHYDSMYGRIESEWRLEDNKLFYSATVPPNTTAILYLPSHSAENVRESKKEISKTKGVKFIKHENGKCVYELNSGTYHFISTI
jgi:alpha-L-rhamnosidase